jgi:hypothetical protein
MLEEVPRKNSEAERERQRPSGSSKDVVSKVISRSTA